MDTKGNKKLITGIIAVIAVILIAVLAGGYAMFSSGVKAVSGESEEVVVTIENGSGLACACCS